MAAGERWTMKDHKRASEFGGIVISIVTYNNEKLITGVLKNILKFSQGEDVRIVVYDNHSKDGTVKAVQSLGTAVELVQGQKNRGYGYGHNRIAERYPKASYYLICNPDLYMQDCLVRSFRRYFEKHPQIGLLTPQVFYPTGKRQYMCRKNPKVIDLFSRYFLCWRRKGWAARRRRMHEMRGCDYRKSFEVEHATGCCMMVRGNVFRLIGGFDEGYFLYFEDADITRRINAVSRAVYYPESAVTHLWTRGSYHSLRLALVAVRSAIRYFHKWGWELW